MKRYQVVLLFLALLSAGCDDTSSPGGNVDTSGTASIDNMLYGTGPYYAIGFNFAEAKEVSSLGTPKPDLILQLGNSLDTLILQTGAGNNRFFLAGEYPDATAAAQAFDNLTAPVPPSVWQTWANPVHAHQVWIYKSADEHYAKLRIVSVFSEERSPRNYAECTFQWEYQPDGSLTFPGK